MSCVVGQWLNFCGRSVKWNFGLLLVLTSMGIFYSYAKDYAKQFLEKESESCIIGINIK